MAEKSNVPEIRFAGFTDPWEQRKFSEIVDVCSGRDYKHLNEGPIPVYGTGGYMTSVSEALSNDRDAIGIGRKGTIDKPYLLKAPFWTVDTLFYAIPKSDINLEFALCSFLNVDWKSKDESTGLPSLSKESINETILSVPNVVEQNRLGSFFADLDSLITLHQRKRRKRLFTHPLVWEQRKLGELAEITSGFMGNSLLEDGEYHLTRIETISTGEINYKRVGFSNENPGESYRLAKGDLLYSNINSIPYIGNVAKYNGEQVLYHGINLLRLHCGDGISSDFLFHELKTKTRRRWAQARANQAVSQASINQSLLSQLPISCGQLQEQCQIANYFNNLDSLITLHQ